MNIDLRLANMLMNSVLSDFYAILFTDLFFGLIAIVFGGFIFNNVDLVFLILFNTALSHCFY